MRPSEIKRKVASLALRPEDHFLELGTYLATLRAVSLRNFKEMTNEFGLGWRKAYYLIQISEQLRPFFRYRSRLQKVGWTKCKIIAPAITRENAAELVRMAESHTTGELSDLMRGGMPKPKSRCVLMYFNPEDYQLFESAILRNGGSKKGKSRGLINKERAIIKIIGKAQS